MTQQHVSSDPGSHYLNGLSAELAAAQSVEQAWESALAKVENGLETWQGAFTETGDYNAARYTVSKVRVLAALEAARARVLAAHRAIVAQQKANVADYEDRVGKGWA